MKTGMNLMELAAEVTRQAKSKRDFLAPTTQITMLPPEQWEKIAA